MFTDFGAFVLSLAGFVLSLASAPKEFVLSLAPEGAGSCFHSQNAAEPLETTGESGG